MVTSVKVASEVKQRGQSSPARWPAGGSACHLRGFWLEHPKWQGHALIGPAVALAARLISEGKLHTPIVAEFSLDEAKLAVARAQSGGKVLFRIHPST